MSHASGQVIKNKKVVGYFEYNGTSDIVYPKIRDSMEAVSNHWREDQPFSRTCSCGRPPEDVVLWSSYGAGFYWEGKACLRCKVIMGEIQLEKIEKIKRGYPRGVK